MVSKFSQLRVIEGQFVPREPKLIRDIVSFGKARVRNRDSTALKLLHIHIYNCYIFELRIEMNFRCHDLSVHLLS